jgi:threonine dehydrogenase-like Zn-dependent dehydrogenase
MYDFNMPAVVLSKLHLAPKYIMVKFRDDWQLPEKKHPNQAIVKTILGGICASDLHEIGLHISYYASILASPINPFPIGHEVVGKVFKGDESGKLNEGDRVVYFPINHCAAYGFQLCPSCQQGNLQQCYCLVGLGDGTAAENIYGGQKKFGGFGGGGFSEEFAAFTPQLYKVPDSIPDEIAVLTEPFVVGLHAVARNMPKSTDQVVVIGMGIIGLMVVASLRVLGFTGKIVAVARYAFQAEKAKSLGASQIISEKDPVKFYDAVAEATGARLFQPALSKRVIYGNNGPDIIFDCVATEESMDDSIRLIKSNGKIVVVGLGYNKTKKIDWSIPVYKETSIVGTMMYGLAEIAGKSQDLFEFALNYLKSNHGLFKGLVTHSFKLDDWKAALECSASKGKNKAIKVVFDYR